MRITGMIPELRTWPAKRRLIAAGVAVTVLVALTLAADSVTVVGGGSLLPGEWWAYAATIAGAGLIGLIVASYIDSPIGGEATQCDIRWPALGLVAIYLTTELREVAPLISAGVRPVIAFAALALLVWALLERLGSERRAVSHQDGEVCTTCKPLFPTVQSRS